MTSLGKRLLKARKMRAISQIPLAAGTKATLPLISMVEQGGANLSVTNLTSAATALDVSVDFLCGPTTDPTPGRRLAQDLADTTTRVRDLKEQHAYVAATDDGDYVGVSDLRGPAGGGAVQHERITGRIRFRREWTMADARRLTRTFTVSNIRHPPVHRSNGLRKIKIGQPSTLLADALSHRSIST